jgi:glycosyltransferase involved in cell wall biosynthesis
MRILFLLSSLEPAGSETYSVTLANAWKGRHEIFWISDRLHFGQTYTSLPIHQKAVPGGIQNTLKVWRYVRENKIELIHSHSRRAHWVAAQVSALSKVPHVTTIHQPPPVHLFSRLFPCLGDHTIAIDETIQTHLQRYFKHGIKQLSLIRNGIDLTRSANVAGTFPTENRLLYLGRLTGGRWKVLLFLFNILKRSAPSLNPFQIHIVGRVPPEREVELQQMVADVNQAIQPSRVELQDFVPDLVPLLAKCRGVIAGGRSAMESLAAGRPVIALGEQGVVGLCNSDTWAETMQTNFGDHFDSVSDHFYPAKLEWGLRQIVGQDPRLSEVARWGRAQVEKHYNILTIAPEIEKIYEGLHR